MYNYDDLLGRAGVFEDIKQKMLNSNQECEKNKGFYIYGNSGIGKTEFTKRLLMALNYDIIAYDAGDFRSKTVLESITKKGMSDKNVNSMFTKKKSIAIIMDEIDGMNSGDKGGINTLIKIIRDKKTKKQKTEDMASCPIICIGNYHIDKKIKELMKVCNTYELKTPTNDQIKSILIHLMPSIINCDKLIQSMLLYINCDLRKVSFIQKLHSHSPEIINNEKLLGQVLLNIEYNSDTKKTTADLLNNRYAFNNHSTIINETDRTIVGLLLHENVVTKLNLCKCIDSSASTDKVNVYLSLLNNFCYADFVDRITFQKQIWQLSEMSSLIKTMGCNKILIDAVHKSAARIGVSADIGIFKTDIVFTKVLTKYSTEYNNTLFILDICQKMSMDKKDVIALFIFIRSNNNQEYNQEYINTLIDMYGLRKLDVCRLYRYIDKCNIKTNIGKGINVCDAIDADATEVIDFNDDDLNDEPNYDD